MKKKLPASRVFALKAHTVKVEKGKYYVAPTGTEQYSGPYKTLRNAADAIARKLQREFEERHKRLEAFHGR